MIIVCSASADTYITDKIIGSSFRATDANVGMASTIDLFKLYDENNLTGSVNQIEISRALLKFDFQTIKDLTGSTIDLNSSNFKAYLQLFDISSGNPVPANFKLVANPLAQQFSEGIGRDVSAFNDLDAANFITASFTNQTNLWFAPGANEPGFLGDDCDYFIAGDLGMGVVPLEGTKTFTNGNEDLSIDVTTLVSATVAGIIPDLGFRLSYSGSQETDTFSRFVKRFGSRQTSNPLLRPKIIVRSNDSIKDKSSNFTLDTSGTVFLHSFDGSSLTNLVSGSALTPITGSNCLLFQLNYNKFNFYVTASQHTQGTGQNFVTGVYSASFALNSAGPYFVTGTTTVNDILAKSGSITFTTYWNSLDKSVNFYTGSLTVTKPDRAQGNFITRRPLLNITNADPYYNVKDVVKFRVFGVDLTKQYTQPVKRPRIQVSQSYDRVYYQVFDRFSGNIIIPYDTVNESTRVSMDSQGMFFDFYMQALPPGRSYGFQFLIVERDQSYVSQEDETYFDVRA